MLPLDDTKPPEVPRPFRTRGKGIWWIPDVWARTWEMIPAGYQILYRDGLRGGVWVYEDRLEEPFLALLREQGQWEQESTG